MKIYDFFFDKIWKYLINSVHNMVNEVSLFYWMNFLQLIKIYIVVFNCTFDDSILSNLRNSFIFFSIGFFFILPLLYFLQFWSQTYFCPKDSYFWLKKNVKFSYKRYISLRYMIEAIKLQLYGQKSPFPRLKIWVDNKIATNIIV